MSYTDEFLNLGVEAFLSRYVVNVVGGMTNQTRSGGQTVQALISGAGFAYGTRKHEVALTAPLVHAYFSLAVPAAHPDMFPFAAHILKVRLDTDDGTGNGVPTYLIPYEGGRALGVKLPDQATDGLEEVYALTAAQNGCTVEISGTPQSPYVSHTNVKDRAILERQRKMTDRLRRLQQRFGRAERAALGLAMGAALPAQNDPTQSRTQFFHYAHVPGGHAVAPAHGVHYTGDVGHIMTSLNDRTQAHQLKGGRVSGGPFSHRRYLFQPTEAAIADLTNPANPGEAQIIGHRSGGNWTFYYQESASVEFEVREVRKIGPKLTYHNQWLLQEDGTRSILSCAVVLNYGRIWPPPATQHLQSFD